MKIKQRMEETHKTIEELLEKFRSVIAKDYHRYRNHVYRVFSNCLLMDSDKTNEERYAIASVYHDIGIWTHHTFDYLAPSIGQVKDHLTETGRQEWTEEIERMINWHHKISQYRGSYSQTVETFRKADWIDVSLALRTFKTDKRKIREIKRMFPNRGFHWFLVKQTVKNFFKHPLNPIPVIKK